MKSPMIKSPMISTPLFGILAASLLLSGLYIPPVDIHFDDKAIFEYTGLVVFRGGVPYRDFFDHKPPLIFLMNALSPLTGYWGLWLMDTLLVMGATVLFFNLCKRYRLPSPWILPLLFNLLIRNYLVCHGIGMTRAYTAIFILMAFCVAIGRPRHTFLKLGILSALTFFMQQDQILALLPFILYALATPNLAHPTSATLNPAHPTSAPPDAASSNPAAPISHRPPLRDIFRHLLLTTVGFAIVTVPILLYFPLRDALRPFWEDAFLFNFRVYAEKLPFIEHFRAAKDALTQTALEMPFIMSLTLGFASFFLRHKNKVLILATISSAVLSFGPESISGKLAEGSPFYYYLLPFSATLPILVFSVWAFTEETSLLGKKNILLYGFLLCSLPLYNALQHASHLNGHDQDWATQTAEYRYLRQLPLSDYQLYIAFDADYDQLYSDHRILSPSPWIYQHFWSWYANWDADHRQLKGIIDDLLRHKTLFILYFTKNSPEKSFLDPSAEAIWNAFLYEHYRLISVPGASTSHIWQLIEPLPATGQQ
jgi:hypothetical protein